MLRLIDFYTKEKEPKSYDFGSFSLLIYFLTHCWEQKNIAN